MGAACGKKAQTQTVPSREEPQDLQAKAVPSTEAKAPEAQVEKAVPFKEDEYILGKGNGVYLYYTEEKALKHLTQLYSYTTPERPAEDLCLMQIKPGTNVEIKAIRYEVNGGIRNLRTNIVPSVKNNDGKKKFVEAVAEYAKLLWAYSGYIYLCRELESLNPPFTVFYVKMERHAKDAIKDTDLGKSVGEEVVPEGIAEKKEEEKAEEEKKEEEVKEEEKKEEEKKEGDEEKKGDEEENKEAEEEKKEDGEKAKEKLVIRPQERTSRQAAAQKNPGTIFGGAGTAEEETPEQAPEGPELEQVYVIRYLKPHLAVSARLCAGIVIAFAEKEAILAKFPDGLCVEKPTSDSISGMAKGIIHTVVLEGAE